MKLEAGQDYSNNCTSVLSITQSWEKGFSYVNENSLVRSQYKSLCSWPGLEKLPLLLNIPTASRNPADEEHSVKWWAVSPGESHHARSIGIYLIEETIRCQNTIRCLRELQRRQRAARSLFVPEEFSYAWRFLWQWCHLRMPANGRTTLRPKKSKEGRTPT